MSSVVLYPLRLYLVTRTGVEFPLINCVMVEAHSSLNCTTVPGVGIGLGFSVIVDGQQSVAPKTTYRPPVITNLPDLKTGYSTRVR